MCLCVYLSILLGNLPPTAFPLLAARAEIVTVLESVVNGGRSRGSHAVTSNPYTSYGCRGHIATMKSLDAESSQRPGVRGSNDEHESGRSTMSSVSLAAEGAFSSVTVDPLCVQMVFDAVDILSKTLQADRELKAVQRYYTQQSRPIPSQYLTPSVFPGTTVEVAKYFIDSIPKQLLAAAAYVCNAPTRALRYITSTSPFCFIQPTLCFCS